MTEHPDIFSAIMSDDLEAVEEMLEADPSLAGKQDGRSPVMLAAYRQRIEILQALLRREPPLDIFEAAAVGNPDEVRWWAYSAPESVNSYSDDGFTPLHLAAFFGHGTTAQYLIERGAKVDAVARNELENMPLHAAAAGGHRGICALLIEHGAPLDARQAGGFTALHAAAQRGDMALAQLLVLNGANASIQSDDEKTPAELAYEYEHDDVAEYLRMQEQK